MRVLFHYAVGPDLAARLAAVPDLSITACAEDDEGLFARLLPETDVIWHVLKPCTAAMIAAAPKLKLIQKIGIGVNTINLDAAKARGIPVCNLPGTNSRAVAELTLALMLGTLRRLPRFDAALRRGIWSDPMLQDGIGELGGRSVGLVGYGAIPRLLAPVLSALGCRLLYTARQTVSDALGEWRTLDALLAESDIVSLHLPLTEATTAIVDTQALARMKPGAILINTARGGLVDQAALTDALRSGRLAAAGLDVFVHEPPDFGEPLFVLPNVVVTPHIAWLTTGTFDRSFALAAENCRRLAAGDALLHRIVNADLFHRSDHRSGFGPGTRCLRQLSRPLRPVRRSAGHAMGRRRHVPILLRWLHHAAAWQHPRRRSPHPDVIRRDRPAGFRAGFLHRCRFLRGLPQCDGHSAPGQGDGHDDQSDDNQHRHLGSLRQLFALLGDGWRLQRI
jgi:phosphoglycerate dehydrogenase-like enzyme